MPASYFVCVCLLFNFSSMRRNALSFLCSSRDPRVILHSDIPNLFAISRCVVPLSISLTRSHLFAKSFRSAGVKRQPKKSRIKRSSSVSAMRRQSSRKLSSSAYCAAPFFVFFTACVLITRFRSALKSYYGELLKTAVFRDTYA